MVTLAGGGIGDEDTSNSFESADDFGQRIFAGNYGRSSKTDAFFGKLDRIGKGRDSFGSDVNAESNSHFMDGLDESFDTLQDGMDGKLEKAATYFEFDPQEISRDDYAFRADMNFRRGMTYDVKVYSGHRRPLSMSCNGAKLLFSKMFWKILTFEINIFSYFTNCITRRYKLTIGCFNGFLLLLLILALFLACQPFTYFLVLSLLYFTNVPGIMRLQHIEDTNKHATSMDSCFLYP